MSLTSDHHYDVRSTERAHEKRVPPIAILSGASLSRDIANNIQKGVRIVKSTLWKEGLRGRTCEPLRLRLTLLNRDEKGLGE